MEKKVKANWRKELDEMVKEGTEGESVCEVRGTVDLEPIEYVGVGVGEGGEGELGLDKEV